MGVSGPKYAGVDTLALEVEDSVPIVPVATAVDASALKRTSSSSLPTARKIGEGLDQHDNEEREDGISITWEKGEVQPSAYRDKWFAVAFVTHLVFVVGAAVALGPAAWTKIKAIDLGSNDYSFDEDEDGDDLYDGSSSTADAESESTTGTLNMPPLEFWFAVVAIALITAPALSFVAFTIMSRNAIGLIKASLWVSVVLCGLAAFVLLFVAPPAGIIYAVFTVCLVWYARRVQNRIPYAASNLKCGITVLKNNLGLGLVSLVSMVGLFGYCVGWVWAFAGTMQLDAMLDSSAASSYSENSSEDQSVEVSAIGHVTVFLFVLSFYWTHQVLKNIVRATVSGVVGTWWFSPLEASSFCSTAVSGSFIRSVTYSLGSICFGSLIVAILHMIRDSLRRAQNSRNGGIVACIALCLLSYIERIVEYFNKWAYIYVGLYGYSYIEAGKRVINLFKTRGWQTIIADNLVNRLLGIMALIIGILTGVCTLFAAFLVEEFESKQGWMGVGFGVGFVLGLVLSGVFMGLLSSAVDACIVCYAEAPKELEDSHPAIAQEMSRAWAEAWGDLSGPVIIGLGGGLGIV
mmetsp:Transcript_32638/g.58931  ORF Transcript_32638/g.58931 Transcript_32638/m.58931 type:complete len:576 (-) Transcript_32638:122-1849(-)|eukprot:CAMPEP_0201879492 /NCGR_PEP_ID=MMETSP0902-20130614/10353_1 /ASSEMBLY_ACC=CAM_ASM_000551 /TAXON_ID=420261 /ORGANISM="Thalassiosira antarctica, Strain CCMP982" /LENGTH=575 /DNA_ID=CAMNT_0048407321 /DNA_START=124 /DNA_END=1851 /DNA_ORIENTATION=-